MSNKSWPIWILGIALLGLALALGSRFVSRGPGPTRANFERLRVGMTVPEVEAIMGPPTEDIDAASLAPPQGTGPSYYADFKKWQESIAGVKKWHGKGGDLFHADFDKTGRVARLASRNLNREKEFP